MELTDATAKRLWLESYQAELLGELLFERLADSTDNRDVQRKLAVLGRMEARTAALLRPVLERHGISTDPDAETLKNAEAYATAAASMAWTELLESLEPNTKQYVERYEQLRALSDDQDQGVVDALLAHERALCEFARRELSGDTSHSLDPIVALPHVG